MNNEQVTPPSSWSAPLERFDRWLRSCGRPASTRYLRLYHLRRLGAQLARGPWEVTAEDLEAHLAAGEWSGNTRRSVRSTLRSFYTWAHSRGLSESNPATLLPSQTAPIGTPRPAPESAIVAGLNALDARVRLMVRLAAEYGLRCSEIAQVHSDDLVEDLVGWSLAVHGKGAKRRIVPLSAAMASIIADARGYLFEGRVDGHLSGAYVSKLVSRYLPPGVTAHMLRHRFASRAYAVDCDLRAVQELLGHASIATTQIYTAVPDGSLRRAVSGAAA